ncbi:Flp pilus assembly protein CpaB [Sulfitobacter sp. 1A10445]|uniref:Flp pilus assembly protein CpaB n=1 Tax=unclassified Sulfitobacter TaxID=196795 RepID=UPI0037459204
MKLRIFYVIISSLTLACGMAWVSVQANNSPEPPPIPEIATNTPPITPTKQYLFAAREIETGHSISPDIIGSQEIEVSQASDNLILDTPENRSALTALLASRAIPMNTPFVSTDLIPPEKPAVTVEVTPTPMEAASPTGVSASLKPNMRAIALPLTGETATAGLISLRDRIDIMVSYLRPDGVRAVRTVLRNVQVIATDQPETSIGEANRPPPKVITLELHPEGAKVLTLAKHTGDLILTLSDETGDEMPIIADDTPVLSTQISGLPAPSIVPPSPPAVQIIRGSTSKKDQIQSTQ